MLCDHCHKNQATVHVQQFINGAKTELHLCPECSAADMPISFDNLFQGFLDSILSMNIGNPQNHKQESPTEKCAVCGMTYDQFKSTGKLGCAECYRTFTHEMEALLKNVQGSIRHEGKFPRRSGVELRQKHEAERLRLLLSKAIEEENFEEAAGLRDRIRQLETPPEVGV